MLQADVFAVLLIAKIKGVGRQRNLGQSGPTHIVLFYRINKRHENSFNCERK
jgi:hypothetical protein